MLIQPIPVRSNIETNAFSHTDPGDKKANTWVQTIIFTTGADIFEGPDMIFKVIQNFHLNSKY